MMMMMTHLCARRALCKDPLVERRLSERETQTSSQHSQGHGDTHLEGKGGGAMLISGRGYAKDGCGVFRMGVAMLIRRAWLC